MFLGERTALQVRSADDMGQDLSEQVHRILAAHGMSCRVLPSHSYHHHHHHHHHHSLNCEGRWGTTDDFATSFLHLFLFSTALWDLPSSRPVHSLMLSSHLFLCLPCLLPPFTVPCKMLWPDLMNGKHDHTTAVCVSLRSSGGLRVVQLPAKSWTCVTQLGQQQKNIFCIDLQCCRNSSSLA